MLFQQQLGGIEEALSPSDRTLRGHHSTTQKGAVFLHGLWGTTPQVVLVPTEDDLQAICKLSISELEDAH